MRFGLYVACKVFTTLTLGAADGGAALGVQGEAGRFLQMYFAPMDGGNFFRLYAPGTGMVEFRRNARTGGLEGRSVSTGMGGVDFVDVTCGHPRKGKT